MDGPLGRENEKGRSMQNVQIANQEAQFDSSPDTLFGVCYSIGRDFGFNPFYLRIALIALGVFSLPASVTTYVALGFTVGLSRMLFPASSNASQADRPAPLREVHDHKVDEVRERELIAA